jgi:hypothetical protein
MIFISLQVKKFHTAKIQLENLLLTGCILYSKVQIFHYSVNNIRTRTSLKNLTAVAQILNWQKECIHERPKP